MEFTDADVEAALRAYRPWLEESPVNYREVDMRYMRNALNAAMATHYQNHNSDEERD